MVQVMPIPPALTAQASRWLGDWAGEVDRRSLRDVGRIIARDVMFASIGLVVSLLLAVLINRVTNEAASSPRFRGQLLFSKYREAVKYLEQRGLL